MKIAAQVTIFFVDGKFHHSHSCFFPHKFQTVTNYSDDSGENKYRIFLFHFSMQIIKLFSAATDGCCYCCCCGLSVDVVLTSILILKFIR